MNRYWDLSEENRAQLTEDQVRAFLTVELMEKGVVQIEPPELRDVEEVELPSVEVYGIEYEGEFGSSELDVVLPSLEAAATFVELGPMLNDYDYTTGSSYRYAKTLPNMSIKPVSLCSEHDVMNAKVALVAREAARSENATAKSAYDESCKAVREATSGVWDDWSACRAKAEKLAAVKATYEEYKLNTEDEERAMFFLLKIYDEDIVTEALGADAVSVAA